jgi:hypothetical protein
MTERAGRSAWLASATSARHFYRPASAQFTFASCRQDGSGVAGARVEADRPTLPPLQPPDLTLDVCFSRRLMQYALDDSMFNYDQKVDLKYELTWHFLWCNSLGYACFELDMELFDTPSVLPKMSSFCQFFFF